MFEDGAQLFEPEAPAPAHTLESQCVPAAVWWRASSRPAHRTAERLPNPRAFLSSTSRRRGSGAAIDLKPRSTGEAFGSRGRGAAM